MLGIYLSGTGNSKHCVERFIRLLDDKAKALPIETENVTDAISNDDFIVVGYPTQFSNAPLMVRDFIREHGDLWSGKKVFCINTMGAFSGDGTGCTARLFKKYGADVLGGLQIKMPDSVCDSKLLKKSFETNRKIIEQADEKIENWVEKIKEGVYPREGLSFFSHIAGLMGQRLWYIKKTARYSDKLKISDDCIKCGACQKQCPMNNLVQEGQNKPKQLGKCTMCYRCVSHCPAQAITLLGKNVVEQTTYEKFASDNI